jgi:hypothetical protein
MWLTSAMVMAKAMRRSADEPADLPGAGQAPVGHAFISYVREDSRRIDQVQQALEAAGIPVWRDSADLWPGEDWRAKIRQAITDNALVFIASFSRASLGRHRSYQNEELVLAIEQLRLRPPDEPWLIPARLPDVPWLIPVRFDDCAIPDRDLGGGRTFASIQSADLFGDRIAEGTARLVTAVLRILERSFSPRRIMRLSQRAFAGAWLRWPSPRRTRRTRTSGPYARWYTCRRASRSAI